LTSTWTDEISNTLTLNQDVSSSLSGDTLRNVQVTGTWSGNCLEVPSDTTLTIDPLHELWHQIGPGHVRVTYTETYRISGTPHLLNVVKDLTYSGGWTLPSDEVFSVANISTFYNPATQIQHDEDDLSLAPAAALVPIWSPPGSSIVAFALFSLGVIALRRRRISQ